jgi:hypothetical protein
MRVAGIHLGVGSSSGGGGAGAVVLDLLLASNFTDTSSYNTAISTVTGAPTFVGSSLYVSGSDKIRTGSADNEPQSHLSLYNKLYTINFDIKLASAAYPAVVFFHSATDSGNTCSISIDSATRAISVANSSSTAVFSAYTLGFDPKADFFNVKLKRTSLTTYELLINDVVVRTVTTALGVMDNNTDNTQYHGFRIGQGAPRPFYIKNFKVTTGG